MSGPPHVPPTPLLTLPCRSLLCTQWPWVFLVALLCMASAPGPATSGNSWGATEGTCRAFALRGFHLPVFVLKRILREACLPFFIITSAPVSTRDVQGPWPGGGSQGSSWGRDVRAGGGIGKGHPPGAGVAGQWARRPRPALSPSTAGSGPTVDPGRGWAARARCPEHWIPF